MGYVVNKLDKLLFPSYSNNWDDKEFRTCILNRISRIVGCSTILDLGAGSGIVEQMNFKGICGSICGIDPDPRVLDNPYLDEAKIGVGEQIPYPDESFDLIYSDNVLEHIEHPKVFFQEVHRTLKPGGYYLAKTANKWHYMPFISIITPYWFHEWFNKLRNRVSDDTFPTRYRANRPADINKNATLAGLETVSIKLLEGRPEYLRMSAFTYILGWIYERIVNCVPLFKYFRIILIAELRKPPANS